jgi:hypothetical protein
MKLYRTANQKYFRVRAYPEVGERVPVIGGWSEAMCHLRLADKPIEVQVVCRERQICRSLPSYPMAQLWVDGEEYSFPFTRRGRHLSRHGRHRLYLC